MKYLDKFVMISVIGGKIYTKTARNIDDLSPNPDASDNKLFMATQKREEKGCGNQGAVVYIIADRGFKTIA